MIGRLVRIGIYLGVFVIVGAVAGYLALRWVVKSEQVVIVPDLTGKDVVYVLEVLTELGLNTKISGYEYRTDVPKNHVAFQDPPPGSEVKTDRHVRIVISKGPQTVSLPDLVGLDLRQAGIIIEENGLVQGAVTEVFAGGETAGEILSQVPGAGAVTQRGEEVDLLVNLGSRPVRYKMPDLVGLLPEDVIPMLERFQLQVGSIRYVQRADRARDVIVEQDPQAGYPVVVGSPVVLTVNREREVVVPEKGFYLFRRAVDEGFLKRQVRLQVSAFGLVYDLFDLFWKPGQDLWMLVPRENGAGFFLYENGELVLTHTFGGGAETKKQDLSDFGLDKF